MGFRRDRLLHFLSLRFPRLSLFYRKYCDPRIIYKRWRRNRPDWQREHWQHALSEEDPRDVSGLGHRWGNPTEPNGRLGNYSHVLELLRSRIDSSTTVLEIGSYGGKWTAEMGGSKKIICVDLFESSFDFLRRRFQGTDFNLEFYKTRGDELEGVSSGSVDLVFSMDSLVRAPKAAVGRYVSETHRVLCPGGELIIHLPCDDSPFSVGMYFTSLKRSEIDPMLRKAGFGNFSIDATTLKHGVIVMAAKEES